MDIRDRRLKARLSKWSTCSVETKRGLVKPRKVIMLKRFLSYYKPQMGLFVADTVCALVLAAIDLAFPIILRNLTGGLFTQGQAAIMQALGMILPLFCELLGSRDGRAYGVQNARGPVRPV